MSNNHVEELFEGVTFTMVPGSHKESNDIEFFEASPLQFSIKGREILPIPDLTEHKRGKVFPIIVPFPTPLV